MLYPLLEKIWKEEKIPKEWEGLIIKIPKKGDLSNCNNWRGITLLTLCWSNLNPYCLGRKAAFFFSGHLNVRKYHYALVRLGQQAAFKSTTL
jgi:hypothetical protein